MLQIIKNNPSLTSPNQLGAIASGLCLIHCIATPFIFIAQSCSTTCCETTPSWWKWIDFLFLFISLLAVYRSGKHSTSPFIKCALWVSWFSLFAIIINEQYHWLILPKQSIYIASISLIIFHLYNLKFCQCKTDQCCTQNG